MVDETTPNDQPAEATDGQDPEFVDNANTEPTEEPGQDPETVDATDEEVAREPDPVEVANHYTRSVVVPFGDLIGTIGKTGVGIGTDAIVEILTTTNYIDGNVHLSEVIDIVKEMKRALVKIGIASSVLPYSGFIVLVNDCPKRGVAEKDYEEEKECAKGMFVEVGSDYNLFTYDTMAFDDETREEMVKIILDARLKYSDIVYAESTADDADEGDAIQQELANSDEAEEAK